jgi:hypothetical protein
VVTRLASSAGFIFPVVDPVNAMLGNLIGIAVSTEPFQADISQ